MDLNQGQSDSEGQSQFTQLLKVQSSALQAGSELEVVSIRGKSVSFHW